MNGISTIIKEVDFTCSAMGGHSEKMAIYYPGSRLSPDMESASTLILDFSSSRTMRNEHCLSFQVYGG